MERVFFFCTFVTSIYAAYFSFDISQHLNTKTPYWSTNEIQQPNDNTCEAIQLNLVARHGSRLPSTSDLSTLSALQGSLDKKGSAITNPLFFWMRVRKLDHHIRCCRFCNFMNILFASTIPPRETIFICSLL